MNEKQTAKLNGGLGVPNIYKPVFVRAYGGKSRNAGIKAFCLDCTGFVRPDITNCTAYACPLYPYRPYQAGNEDDAQELVEPDETQAK